FRIAFHGRYDAGLAVMPWTLTYCAWYSLLLVAQNYVWCTEKMRLGTLPLAIGLAVNIAINLVLVPAWGLLGAVVSTTVATGAALGLLYWINRYIGMRVERGMVLFSTAPLALCGGALCGSVVVVLLAAAMPFSRTLFTQHERERFAELGRVVFERINAYWARRAERGEAKHAV
ncbi:MAG TPA: polysaccharide biosynthesis C-terminal domain-containing protein, partial [Lacipirellulaceae bacterium]|nr:polysaccharide biosynthesis C-terminal domain-containing protein [Lacipirellulaceae bacterium]